MTPEDHPPSADEEGQAATGDRALLLAARADWLAVPLAVVRVVLERPAITRVPEGPAALVGVVNVRGEVVPVIDTALVLGLGDPLAPEVVAVLDSGRGPVGLTATAVRSDPLQEDLGPSDLPLATGRRRAGPDVATVLDVEALVATVAGARA
ncbi:MAG: Positive regulator of CheA protein [Solirubrobacterales bacterium]|nr:Positive regulator of CheA protein [Solirubrobacterales bacterium]